MSVPDHFDLLQNKLVDRLAKNDAGEPDPFLSDTHNGKTIQVLDERVGDLGTMIDQILETGLGIAIVVIMPVARLRNPEVAALDMIAAVKVQVQENVLLNQSANGTKVTAMALRDYAMRKLHHWPHQLYPGRDDTQRVKLMPVPFVLVQTDPMLTYDVDATAPINLSAPLRS